MVCAKYVLGRDWSIARSIDGPWAHSISNRGEDSYGEHNHQRTQSIEQLSGRNPGGWGIKRESNERSKDDSSLDESTVSPTHLPTNELERYFLVRDELPASIKGRQQDDHSRFAISVFRIDFPFQSVIGQQRVLAAAPKEDNGTAGSRR